MVAELAETGIDQDVDMDLDSDVEDTDSDMEESEGDLEAPEDDDLSEEEEAEYQEKMAALRKEKDGVESKKKPEKDNKSNKNSEEEKEKPQDNEEEENVSGKKDQDSTGEKTHTIKVNGVEKQVSTQDLIVMAQKAESADQRFEESAKHRKQVAAVMELAQNDPMTFLDKIGVKPEKVEQWLYDNHIAPNILEGDEKEQWERNREFERLKAQEKQREEQDKNKRIETTREAYQRSIIEAVKSSPEVPKTDWTVNRVAQYMQRAFKAGYRDVTPSEVMPYVAKDWNKIKSSQLESLDEDQMLKYLGEEGTEKVRRALLKKMNASKRKPRTHSTSGTESRARPSRKQHRKTNPRSPYDLI